MEVIWISVFILFFLMILFAVSVFALIKDRDSFENGGAIALILLIGILSIVIPVKKEATPVTHEYHKYSDRVIVVAENTSMDFTDVAIYNNIERIKFNILKYYNMYGCEIKKTIEKR